MSATVYLFALGAISTTFVGFTALILVFRQTVGGGLSKLDSWLAIMFVQLGFIVTGGSLVAPLLTVCGVDGAVIWRSSSAGVGLVMAVFALSYPARRRAVSGVPTPPFVWVDLSLLGASTLVLAANAAAWPLASSAGAFCIGLTGVMFIAGVGFLQALGGLHRDAGPLTS